MKVRKDLINDLIKITQKYYLNGDVDYLPALQKAREILIKSINELNGNGERKGSYIADLVGDLGRYTYYTKLTNDAIYKALNGLGIEIIE